MSQQSAKQLDHLRHSTAHLLAAAVLELYPGTKNTIGPAIENGFYYDFEFTTPISEDDLPKIEKKMRQLVKRWHKFDRLDVTADQAREHFHDNQYKIELINEFSSENQSLTFYQSGQFIDLCRGGHIENPSTEIKYFKLLSLAGAYWRGDEQNVMLTRIYGTAFATQAELDAYLTQLEEAKKRDHRKLGKQLDLFTFSDLVGPGLPLWTPKGTLMRHILDEYVWNLRSQKGYQRVEIPHLTKKDLYVTSGHWEKFADELFRITTREGHEFAMKPMNCPHHTQIYARQQWSYRDLPQRYANTTMCYRDEQTGELHGLSRVRALTQDDAHVFCRLEQAPIEMSQIWDIVNTFYGSLGFELQVELSFHDPENMNAYLGSADQWRQAEDQMKSLANKRGVEYTIHLGEAAFYGPKIDFIGLDSIGRTWQLATIQLDMNMPERFDLSCVNEDGEHERIVMIHAAIMGSIERFLSNIIEHFAGAFPLWLAPVQISIISVGQDHHEYCTSLAAELNTYGLRTEVENSNETVGKKIRNSIANKIPYVLVIGDKELQSETLMIRVRGEEELRVLEKAEFIQTCHQKIQSKDLTL